MIAAFAALLFIASIVVGDGGASKALMTAAISSSFIFVAAFVSTQKKAEGISVDIGRRTLRVEEDLSHLVDDISAQKREREVAPLRSLGSDARGSSDEDCAHVTSIFAPSTIPATQILGRPTAHTAGRLAAEQEMEHEGSIALQAMMSARSESWVREISLIGSQALKESLAQVGKVERVVGPHLMGQVGSKTSYLVIDEKEFLEGPWQGILSAQKTGLYLKLSEYVSDARERGIVVVVLAKDSISHFTNDLRDSADVVLDMHSASWKWESDAYSPVIQTLVGVQKRQLDPGLDGKEGK